MVGFAPSRWEVPPNSVVLPMANPSIHYYKTMEARLHIFDGVGLHHYRMIYESKPDNLWQKALEITKQKGMEKALNDTTIFRTALMVAYQNTISGYPMPIFTQEVLTKYVYRVLYQKKLGIELQSLAPSGYVKIFERVKGAKITGRVENATQVELTVTIKTNQNRTFDYVLKTNVTDGTYSFIVPYAQDTSYAVKPITPYRITAGGIVKEVNVTEEQVLNGETIHLDLI
jgi:dolichyl-diphosphooligosaccharide--protein glycosyltransferase